MRSRPVNSSWHLKVVAASLAVCAAVVLPGQARALDLLGLYVGGAVGQARVETFDSKFTTQSFKANHSGFKAMLGVRPISVIGGEVDYIDFGHPNGNLAGYPADATLKGAAAFAIVYLPVPVIDVYAKAGVARLQSTLNGSKSVCSGSGTNITCGTPTLFRLDSTDTHVAVGAGLQFKLGAFAVRTEYEYFNSASAHPALWSLGATWTFL